MTNEPTRMWDVTTGKQLWQVDGEVDAIAFDLESDRVALYPYHEGARVFDVDSGAKVLDISPKYKVTTVAFDASGGVLATIGDGGLCTFFAWDPQKKAWTEVPFGNTGFDFRDAGFLAERTDDRLVMTTKQREVLLWTLDKPFHAIGGHRADISAIGVATKRRVFATADTTGEVKLWAYTGALLGENADAHQAIRTLVFSHDAAMLVGIGDDPHVFVWNAALGLRGTLLAPGDEFESVSAIAIAPDDSRIAAVDELGDRIRVWKPPRANLVGNHLGSQVALADHVAGVIAANQLVVLETATGAVKRQLLLVKPAVKPVRGVGEVDRSHLEVTADGTRALVWTSDGADVYDLVAAKLIRSLPRLAANDTDNTIWELSASGRRVVELGDQRLRVHEVDGGGVVLDVEAGDQRGGALSPDESRLIQAGTKPRAWHVPGGAPIALPELAIDTTKITTKQGRDIEQWTDPDDLVFSADGKRIVVLGMTTPLVVDAGSGTVISRLVLTPLSDSVQTARLDTGGHRVVTQVAQLATVWNADTGALVFQVPNTALRAVAITPDGERIATGGDDGTVRIWDASGRLLEQIHGHRRAITALAFTPDGTRLVAQGAEDEVTIWDVHLEQRSPDEISAIAAKATPWQVAGGQLVLRKSP
jgi:WD40 repeat protein